MSSESSKFLRQLAHIAVPQAVQMMLFSSSAFIDSIMLGQLGTQEVAASGLADRAWFLMLLVMFGASSAGNILAAQYRGAGNHAGFRKAVALSTMAGISIGGLASLLFLFASAPIIGLGTDDPRVLELGSMYLTIIGLTMIGAGWISPLEGALNCVDRTIVATRYGVLEAAVNVTLNYGLIFGHWGLPAMGMEGAAWGSLVARSLRVGLLVGHIYLFEREIAWTFADLNASLERSQLRRYLDLCIPAVLNHFVWAGGVFTLRLIYGRMGVSELAATSVLWNFQRFVLSILIGLSVGCSILVGKAIGAGKPELARWRVWVSLKAVVLVGLVLDVGMYIVQPWVLGFFDGVDAATMALAASIYPLMLVDIMIRGITLVVIVGGLKAGGDLRYCLKLDTVAAWGLIIPLVLFCAFYLHWGLYAVFAVALGEELFKSFLSIRRLRGGKWIRNLATESEPN